jgi:phosphate transport system substrate-binding protein
MRKLGIALALLAVSALLFAGGTTEAAKPAAKTVPLFDKSIKDDKDGLLPRVNPVSATGGIIAAGSSTVFPLAERMVERFKKEGFAGSITVDSIGTGAGFERFCKTGETDISNASRPIKSSEADLAKAIGRTPVEFRIGTDALAICVSKANTFIKNATKAELARIFGAAQKWSDVNPAWPAQPIKRFIPGTDSGTFDYFAEVIFAAKKEPLLQATNVQLSEDDNILVQGIEGSPYSIGFFGFAYYVENKDKLTVLSVEGIEPNQETVDAAKYPLARPLFMYSDAKIMREKPQVAALINFTLTFVNDEIRTVGYFPANPAALKQAKQSWLTAMEGTY